MDELEIIEFLLQDERFEDTVLITNKKIMTGVKTGNFTRAFLELLSRMEAPYTICDGTITVTRPKEEAYAENITAAAELVTEKR